MFLKNPFCNPLSLSLVLATVATCSLSESARATTFNFSYTFGPNVLSGKMTGDIQADGNTVFVTSITSPQLNGVDAPALPYLTSISDIFGAGPVSPTVSFSGSTMDLCATTAPSCSVDGFSFIPASFGGTARYSAGPSYGAVTDIYDPTQWSLIRTDIPEPSAVVALVVMGGGLLLCKRGNAA